MRPQSKYWVLDSTEVLGKMPHFPATGWDGWTTKRDKPNEVKYSCNNLERIAEFPALHRAINKGMSKKFCQWLSELTGIPELKPDRTLTGAGLHHLPVGGHLGMHTDFNRLDKKYRRVNVLVYLNDGFTAEDGGQLRLWDGTEILPNRPNMVIFTTSETSFHGNPVPTKKPRNSIAMYYYTRQRPAWYVHKHSTVFEEGKR